MSVPRNMNHFMALRKAQQRKNRFKASREDRKEGEPIELDRSRSLPAEPSGPRRKRRNSSLSVAPPPAQVQDDLADWRKTMSEFLTASVYSDLDNVVIERLVIKLCENQIFNPTSMCAYSNASTHALRLCFENSTRAIDSS